MDYRMVNEFLTGVYKIVTDPEAPAKIEAMRTQISETINAAVHGICDSTRVVDGSMTDDGAKYRQHRCSRVVEHPGQHKCRYCGEYFSGRSGHVVGLRARGVREIETIEDWGGDILSEMPSN